MLNNLLGGMTVAFGVLGTIAVANVITSYLLPNGQTIRTNGTQHGGDLMLPLPRMSFDGIFSFVLVASGLVLGVAIFNPPMDSLENAFKRRA